MGVLALYTYQALTVSWISIDCHLGNTINIRKALWCFYKSYLERAEKGFLLFMFMLLKGLLTCHLEDGRPVTNGVPFPPTYQGLWLSLQGIVGKCMLPSARLKVTIRPAFLIVYCFVNKSFLSQVQAVCSQSVTKHQLLHVYSIIDLLTVDEEAKLDYSIYHIFTSHWACHIASFFSFFSVVKVILDIFALNMSFQNKWLLCSWLVLLDIKDVIWILNKSSQWTGKHTVYQVYWTQMDKNEVHKDKIWASVATYVCRDMTWKKNPVNYWKPGQTNSIVWPLKI